MKVKKGLVAMGFAGALLATMAVAPRADAEVRIVVRPGFGFYHGPAYYGPAYYGPRPGWYRPWSEPRYVVVPMTGDVKINTPIRSGSIYVDGGFVGETGKLKKLSLPAGNHRIEVRDAFGRNVYDNTINVIVGRAVDIDC